MANRRLSLIQCGAFVALWISIPACRGPKDPVSLPKGYTYSNLDVGLTSEIREALWSTSEGSNLFPVEVLKALRDFSDGKQGAEPFIVTMKDFGFLPREVSESNPFGLPVGWTVHVPELSPNKLNYAGINCVACHTGQIEYEGRRLRIDGAPNMVDLEKFGIALRDSVVATLEDPIEAFEFLRRLLLARHRNQDELSAALEIPGEALQFVRNIKTSGKKDLALARLIGESVKHISNAEGPNAGSEMQSLIARGASEGLTIASNDLETIETLLGVYEKYVPVIQGKLDFAQRAIHAFENSPEAGPGRDDPWGIIRNLVFKEPSELVSPVSIPHLFHLKEFDWIHADGNTTSVMDRNIAQAVALGAYWDEKTNVSSFLPRQIHQLEEWLSELQAPEWPEAFGAINPDLAAKGAAVFERKIDSVDGVDYSCKDCHDSWRGALYPIDLLETDPYRARDFQKTLANGKSFPTNIVETIGPIRDATYEHQGITAQEAESFDRSNAEWRATGQYLARRLDGVWATAPYLHNGSAPTLYDLLSAPNERPKTFPLGHREFDPKRVGYKTEVADPIFTFDTSINGNSNSGHAFGVHLSQDDRWALIEYLKTL